MPNDKILIMLIWIYSLGGKEKLRKNPVYKLFIHAILTLCNKLGENSSKDTRSDTESNFQSRKKEIDECKIMRNLQIPLRNRIFVW